MRDFDAEIEDILANTPGKKRRNSGRKGKRGERELCRLLTARFGKPFERVVGSGNRWSQVNALTESAKNVLIGDVVCPEDFRFTLESKVGYEDKIDLFSAFANGNRTIDEFLKQVSDDAERSGKRPLLLYKRKLRPWLAILKSEDLAGVPDYMLSYRDWRGVALEWLLGLPDAFFFA